MKSILSHDKEFSKQEKLNFDATLEEKVEIKDTQEILDPQRLLNELQEIDWDFSEANTAAFNHDLHPYPAKFIPQIPEQLISRMSFSGEKILDPFGGSGTTALEAIRLGRIAISLDANPVSKTIGKAKTANLLSEEVESLRRLISAVENYYEKVITGKLTHEELLELHKKYVPAIPNIEKWFEEIPIAELALLKHLISTFVSKQAEDVALTAFLKIVMKVCNQESETRYSSTVKKISSAQTLKYYHSELTTILYKVLENMKGVQNSIVDFREADARIWETWKIEPESISLIVTSPPYPNAYDYHLYHRFRIFWLGKEPRDLRKVEIGSHLRHQSKKDGFEGYLEEMVISLENMYTALQSGRYAVLVVGNGVYQGVEYETGTELLKAASKIGFEAVGKIERNLPKTKRSVTSSGRRLQREDIIILRKPNENLELSLSEPNYSLTPYEKKLKLKEIKAIKGIELKTVSETGEVQVICSSERLNNFQKLAFVDSIKLVNTGTVYKTWQSKLESSINEAPKNKKEPKYATHGIHAYKGKFYPQLAKSLINISNVKPGATILDPFMGSGTVLLESYLNGYRGVGMDMNPMAAHIAEAKLKILEEKPQFVKQTIEHVIQQMENVVLDEADEFSEFPESCHIDIVNWFPGPVIKKINYILKKIRHVGSENITIFLEVCLSDIIREVSYQDPTDLRIRKRKVLLDDAPVFEMFKEKLNKQLERLLYYWSITPYCPTKVYEANSTLGDNRIFESFLSLGLKSNSVDLVITSPPYFTALPYIDTDRLSLLTILGIPRKENIKIEKEITGSREITKQQQLSLIKNLEENNFPDSICSIIQTIQEALSLDESAGFRRQNIPALLARYFSDMDKVFKNIYKLLKKDGIAWVVIGNNKTKINNEEFLIDSVNFLKDIASINGFILHDEIDITVTREGKKNSKNSITENGVLGFKKIL